MHHYHNNSKKIIFFLILSISIILFSYSRIPSFALASNNNLDLLLEQIQNKSSSIQAFSCKFNQTRHLAIFSKPVIFSGILTLSKPAKLRWEVLEPIPSTIILNESTGMRCSEHNKQFRFDLASGPKMHMAYKQFFQWLSGSIDSLREFYEVKLLSEYRIELIPLDERFSDIIKSIEIEFGPGSLQPSQVIIRENQDDYTEIVFTDYNLTPNLTASIFTECHSM